MPKLSVLFNDLISFRSQGGIAAYTRNLRPFLKNEIQFFSQTGMGFPLARLSQIRKVKTSIQGDSSFEKLTQLFNFYLSYRKYQLFHEPDLIVPETRVPAMATVHDLSVLLTPEYHPSYRVKKYEKELKASLDRTVYFLCNSEITKSDVVNHLNIPPTRCTVTPLAPNSNFKKLDEELIQKTKAKFGLPANYFVFVGTLEPRKNIPFLLEMFDSLAEDFKKQYPLLILGNWGWQTQTIQKAFNSLKTPSLVRHLEALPDSELVAIVNGAKALLFPSLSEGFGLPILEAFQCETPVICSDIPIFREVAKESAIFCSLKNMADWHVALNELVEDSKLALELKAKARVVLKSYSWGTAARLTLEAYHKALSM